MPPEGPDCSPWGSEKLVCVFSPVHAVSGCHHPVVSDEGPSAGVVPLTSGQVLKGNLDGKGGKNKWYFLKGFAPNHMLPP